MSLVCLSSLQRRYVTVRPCCLQYLVPCLDVSVHLIWIFAVGVWILGFDHVVNLIWDGCRWVSGVNCLLVALATHSVVRSIVRVDFSPIKIERLETVIWKSLCTIQHSSLGLHLHLFDGGHRAWYICLVWFIDVRIGHHGSTARRESLLSLVNKVLLW